MAQEYLYHITDIDWDTEGEVIDDLPTQLVLKSSTELDDYEIADWMTEEFGWLVNGYCDEELDPYTFEWGKDHPDYIKTTEKNYGKIFDADIW